MYMGSKDLGAEDDLKQVIIDFINGAVSQLDIAIQELEEKEIAEVITAKKQEGLKVSIVLEMDYLRADKPSLDPFTPGGKKEPNRMINNALFRSAIKLNSDFNTNIFHQKFIIRDVKSVLTGSTNFTPTGVNNNLNHIVIVHDEKVAREYMNEFKEIQKGNFGRENSGHTKTPKVIKVDKIPIKILFAPEHNPEMEIMKQMAKAKNRIDFAIFTFSQTSGIDDVMKALVPNMPIRGVIDHNQGSRKWAATHGLIPAGCDIRTVKKKGKLNKLHHKLMVLDEKVVIAGSFNYTEPANKLNDENIIIIGDLETTDPLVDEQQKQIGAYALKEIDRIYNTHGTEFVAPQ